MQDDCENMKTGQPEEPERWPGGFENRLLTGSMRETAINQVYACGDIDAGGARTIYSVWRGDHSITLGVEFQEGPRFNQNDREGVQDIDLLLMIEDRLIAYQDGEYACDENAKALIAVQAAIYNLRAKEERKIG